MKKLTCYQISPAAPRIVPGQSARTWMDGTRDRYAYRCLPLTIANAMGWEILLPARVTAEWNGGPELADISIEVDPSEGVQRTLACSHFGYGILTFLLHYLFRTEPGIGILARGVPNRPKDGIAPLEGIIETDWLDFTFTMNWQFTRPGRVTFEKDEPICFITPIEYHALDNLVPEIVPLASEPELNARYKAYGAARTEFNERLMRNDPEAEKLGWQKWYMRGQSPAAAGAAAGHMSKLRLASPSVAVEPPSPANSPLLNAAEPSAD